MKWKQTKPTTCKRVMVNVKAQVVLFGYKLGWILQLVSKYSICPHSEKTVATGATLDILTLSLPIHFTVYWYIARHPLGHYLRARTHTYAHMRFWWRGAGEDGTKLNGETTSKWEISLNKHTHSSRRMNARGSLRGLKLNVNPEVSTLLTGIRVLLRKRPLHYERSHTQIAFGRKNIWNVLIFTLSVGAFTWAASIVFSGEQYHKNTSPALELPQLLPGSRGLLRNFSPISSDRSRWHVTTSVDRGATGKRWRSGAFIF